MTAVKNLPGRASVIDPPADLPSFAAFAVSYSSEPPPALEPGEQEVLSDRAVPTRRESFARGRAAAHSALRAIGLDHGPILSGPGREPVWPRGARGAVSHAAGVGVALVAPMAFTDGVGVDIEEQHRVPDLWEHVPRPEERRWLDDLDETDREAAILGMFSAKESVFKAFFPRVRSFFGFEQASLTPTPSGFVGRLMHDLDDDYPRERTFEITCAWFGDLVLTSVVLPVTPGTAKDPKSNPATGAAPYSHRADWSTEK